jgi:hypothetical protein
LCAKEYRQKPEIKAAAEARRKRLGKKRDEKSYESFRAYSSRYRQRNPDKSSGTPTKKAHRELKRAIRNGEIIKPSYCSNCGRTNCRIEGHHPDYDKPLKVVWLCVSCHKSIE